MNMKKSYRNTVTLGLLCAGALLMTALTHTGFAATQANGDGRLVITRSPKLGSGTAITLFVDGKKVRSLQSFGKYDGPIPAGKHTVMVKFEPISAAEKPANIEINVVSGQTYSFSATIQHGDIVLAKNR